jgi:Ca2+-binding RTX toxin-like protein
MAIITGTADGESLVGTVGNDSIDGLGGNDSIEGGRGDDTLIGGTGNDTLIGGAGLDIANYATSVGGYTFSTGGDHSIIITDINSADGNTGTDVLREVEAASFLDGLVGIGAGDLRVNSTTADNQMQPAIAALSDGGYVVVWQSNSQDLEGYGIFAQRYDASGIAVGYETQINDTGTGNQTYPTVTALTGGGYAIAWMSDPNDGSSYNVYARHYDAMGHVASFEGMINKTTHDLQTLPSIAGLAGGGYVVAWQSNAQDGSGYGIYAHRYGVAGDIQVNTTTASSQTAPVVAALADGGYVVAWQSLNQDAVGLYNGGIYAQRYDAGGVAVGTETRINTTTANDQFAPSIAALAGGGYIICWQSSGQDGSGAGIYAQRYDAAGSAVGTETRINTYTSGDQTAPCVAALHDGGYIVTWQSNLQDGSSTGIYVQRYDSAGATVGGEILVNTTTADAQANPAITVLANGGYVITWQSDLQDTSGNGIYAQLFDVGGHRLGAELTGAQSANLLVWTGSDAVRLDGGAGDDTLAGGTASDALIGGPGNDLVSVPGLQGQYTIGNSSSGGLVVSSALPGGTSDTLIDVETLSFADGSITVKSGETRVNTNVTFDQRSADVVGLADGGYLVTWQSNADGGYYNIHAQRYDAAGSAQGSETLVTATYGGDQSNPVVMALADGGYTVVWECESQYSMGFGYSWPVYDIYAQRYDVAGTAVGSAWCLDSPSPTSSHMAPAVASFANGGYVTIWEANDANGRGIYARQFDAAGVSNGGEFLVNSTTAGDQSDPAVAALSGGGYVATWVSAAQDGSGNGIYAQRYTAAGARAGAEVRINMTMAGDQDQPSVYGLASGGYVVVWTSADDGSLDGIYACCYSSNGDYVTSEVCVNDSTVAGQSAPDVAALADGGYVIVWQSQMQDGSGDGIYAQRYDAAGRKAGPETRINATTTDGQTAPAVAALADGGYVVTWTSMNQDGSQGGIYSQRFDAANHRVGDQLLGDAGDSTIIWTGQDPMNIDGGSGNDSLAGGSANDSLTGGLGLDTLHGGAGNDVIKGGDQADMIFGEAGNDVLNAGKGLDTLDGGSGNDTLTGGIGNDVLIGGDGSDTASYSTSSDGVTVNLAAGVGGSTVPIAATGSGADALSGVESVIGSAFNDVLAGDGNANRLEGGSGDDNLSGGLKADTLLGGDGNDTLAGGQGMDSLDGGAGNDILKGALGTDILTGGAGSDHFQFASVLDGALNIDTITDFVSGTDVIELSASVFTAYAGQVGTTVGLGAHLNYSAATGILSYDADGAGGSAPVTFAILGTSGHPGTLGMDFLIVA